MNWWLHSDAGLMTRVAVGVSVFAVLALWDWRAKGTEATRWREYLFLLLCVISALAYGIINDQITTTISWEYFAYGKGVAELLPVSVKPNSAPFRWEVAKIGMKATWSAGLIVGVALLVANNPRAGRTRLTYTQLARSITIVFAITASVAVALGLAGYCGAFVPISRDFAEMLAQDQWRPRRFMAVYGIHLGGYIGALCGIGAAVVRITRRRHQIAS